MTELNPDIVFDLARSGDPQQIQELFDLLDADGLSPNERTSLEYGLVAGAPKTIDPIIARLRQTPSAKSGLRSAYYLGEIAYQQKYEQDPRIVPELIRAFDQIKGAHPDKVYAAIGALGECCRFHGIPEAQRVAEEGIQIVIERREFLLDMLDYCLEIYFVNKGWAKTVALGEKLGKLPEGAPMLEEVEDFLKRQKHRPKGYEPIQA